VDPQPSQSQLPAQCAAGDQVSGTRGPRWLRRQGHRMGPGGPGVACTPRPERTCQAKGMGWGGGLHGSWWLLLTPQGLWASGKGRPTEKKGPIGGDLAGPPPLDWIPELVIRKAEWLKFLQLQQGEGGDQGGHKWGTA
jgi:hypothetical protein